MGRATGSKLECRVGNKTRAAERLGVKQAKCKDNVDGSCDRRRRRGRWGIVTVSERVRHPCPRFTVMMLIGDRRYESLTVFARGTPDCPRQ